MAWLYYKGNWNIEAVMREAPYPYRATTEYALSLLGINNKPEPPSRRIYVNRRNVPQWRCYLQEHGFEEILPEKGVIPTWPDIILDVVPKLPDPMTTNPRVLNSRQLLEELAKGAPRLVENHPEIIRRLKKIA